MKRPNIQSLLARISAVPRTAILFAGALIFAAVTAIALSHYLTHRESLLAANLRARYQGHEVEVVVPRSDLPAGARANSANMATRQIPADLVYPFTVTLAQWPQLSGERLSHAVYAGKPLLKDDFTPGSAGDFSAHLPPGLRAVTITVNPSNAIAGLMRPGDRVAVLFLAHKQELPLLHHVEVLATGAATTSQRHHHQDGGDSGFGTITLAVTPRQAGALTLAQQVGSLRVVLDPPHEKSGSGLPHLTLAGLYGLSGAGHGDMTNVQYIIGGGSGNSVHMMPVGQPVPTPPPTKSPTAGFTRVQTQTNKELATLKNIMRHAQATKAHSVSP